VLAAASRALQGDLEKALAAAGASCQFVGAAELAVERAMSEDFDLLLLDARLPGIGAAATADILRRAGSTCLIVALVDAADAAAGRAHALRDFDAVLRMPLENEGLLAVILKALEQRPQNAEVGTKLEDEFADLARQFRTNLPVTLDALCSAALDGKLATLSSLLHRLKGSAGSYGFPHVTDECAKIEKQLSRGLEYAAVSACLSMVQSIREELQAMANDGTELTD
jgi:HPt (histidine-containing phosphotransfer) domain-containing protein